MSSVEPGTVGKVVEVHPVAAVPQRRRLGKLGPCRREKPKKIYLVVNL